MLKDHPNYSARKLAEVIGITPKAIEKHLAKLKAEGLIKREGPDKGGSIGLLGLVFSVSNLLEDLRKLGRFAQLLPSAEVIILNC